MLCILTYQWICPIDHRHLCLLLTCTNNATFRPRCCSVSPNRSSIGSERVQAPPWHYPNFVIFGPAKPPAQNLEIFQWHTHWFTHVISKMVKISAPGPVVTNTWFWPFYGAIWQNPRGDFLKFLMRHLWCSLRHACHPNTCARVIAETESKSDCNLGSSSQRKNTHTIV